ncbi:MAG: uracil-DNA glycosylase family protein, partial [Saprospiraceae bacterium]|nr:uracil-DNA glycosylase family protein [Saprospiraceae bacterium]
MKETHLEEVAHLLAQIRACQHCAEQLPLGARPIVSFSNYSKIVLVSQAPGLQAHEKGVPYQDQSGIRLRHWLGVDEVTFYNANHFAILPMGFCYPGKAASGDLPPCKACAPLWHESVWKMLPHVQLTLLIGQYAQTILFERGN